jgi:hypothetical protein
LWFSKLQRASAYGAVAEQNLDVTCKDDAFDELGNAKHGVTLTWETEAF